MPLQCAMDLNYIVLDSACSSVLWGVYFFIAIIPLESEYYAHHLLRLASWAVENLGLEVAAVLEFRTSRGKIWLLSRAYPYQTCYVSLSNLGVLDRATAVFS